MTLPSSKQPLRSQYQRIEHYYATGDESVLSFDDEEVNKRWLTAHDLLFKIKSTRQVAKMLVARFQISLRVAYLDINCARELFAFTTLTRRAALAKVQQMAEEVYEKALVAGDLKTADSVIGRLVKAFQLDKPEKDILNPDDFRPIIYATYDPKDLKVGAVKGDLRKRTQAYLENKAKAKEEDIDFEEVEKPTDG